jgi:hypothetical protein
VAAHGAAAAGKEQVVARGLQKGRAEDRAALQPAGQGDAALGAETAVGAGVKGQPGARSGGAETGEGLQPRIQVEALAGIGGVVAPVPGDAQGQRQAAKAEGAAGVAAFGVFIGDPGAGGQRVGVVVAQRQADLGGVGGIVDLVQVAQQARQAGGGVGRKGGGAVQRDAQRIVDTAFAGPDVGDAAVDLQPLSAAQKVAVQPVAGQRQAIQAGRSRRPGNSGAAFSSTTVTLDGQKPAVPDDLALR